MISIGGSTPKCQVSPMPKGKQISPSLHQLPGKPKPRDIADAREAALAEAIAIVRAVFDETPGTAADVYIRTCEALDALRYPEAFP